MNLIRDHLKEVTGIDRQVRDVNDAYAKWESQTKEYFGLSDSESAERPPLG